MYEVSKIINAKRKLSISEQLEMLYALQRKLVKKLKVLRKGYKVMDLKFQNYADWKYKNSRTSTQIKAAERMTSNMSEGGPKTTDETALIAEPASSPPPAAAKDKDQAQSNIMSFKTIKQVVPGLSTKSKVIKKSRV